MIFVEFPPAIIRVGLNSVIGALYKGRSGELDLIDMDINVSEV